MSREQSLVERAGGEYLGIEEGLVWFNDPCTHSTMTVEQLRLAVMGEGAAIEDLRFQISQKRAAFARGDSEFRIQNSEGGRA